ncbi:hypothetical protein BGW37DRAFT_467437 [Umbelopsis sp. PMI_123]|nr:hypothetical protein BGW37DRAFT_467437 [Umbelopsis sp. PMI_123]
MKIPTVTALSEFELGKVASVVYGQLAQGAVVACFSVLLTRAAEERPIRTLAEGPLSSISSIRWLWKYRGGKSNAKPQMVQIEINEDYDPKLSIKHLVYAALPGLPS